MSRHTRDDARRSMVLLIAGRRGEPLRKAGRDDSESEREKQSDEEDGRYEKKA